MIWPYSAVRLHQVTGVKYRRKVTRRKAQPREREIDMPRFFNTPLITRFRSVFIALGVITFGAALAGAGGLVSSYTTSGHSTSGGIISSAVAMDQNETFIYSGGCFWCTEADTEKLDGVVDTISGFTGGTTDNPKYFFGQWGDHREAALVIYNPKVVSFEDLVKHVYTTIDYEDADGQFCDRGRSYSPAIYVKNDEQAAIATQLAPATSIVPIEREGKFYPVRDAHQDFYKKRAKKYNYYRQRCGRDRRVSELNG